MSLDIEGQEITRPKTFYQFFPFPATTSHSLKDKDEIRNVVGILPVYAYFLR